VKVNFSCRFSTAWHMYTACSEQCICNATLQTEYTYEQILQLMTNVMLGK